MKHAVDPALLVSRRAVLACATWLALGMATAHATTTYVFTTIDPPGATWSQVFGLNDNGELVVSSSEGGAIYQNGVYSPLKPGPTGFTMGPEGINDSGDIVGTASDASGNPHPFVLSGGTYSIFDVPGYQGGMQDSDQEARAISPSGNVVSGIFTDSNDNLEGYTYDRSTGVFTAINPPGSVNTFAQGMNSAGQLAGSGTDLNGVDSGFVYQNGSYSSFRVDGLQTAARGINDLGVITGHVTSGTGLTEGFVGSPSGGFQLLADPSAGTNSHASVFEGTLPEAINNSGQIVGEYGDAHGNTFGFLATPATLPNGRTAGGAFTFDMSVVPNDLFYIDPAVASGYEYQTGSGDPNFQSVVLPIGIGDNMYSLSLCNGSALGSVAGGAAYQFSSGGVSCFDVKGIPSSAGLDPGNPEAFVTGLTFATAGDFTGTMTPMTAATAAPEIDPAGALGAITLLAGLLAVMRGRRPAAA